MFQGRFIMNIATDSGTNTDREAQDALERSAARLVEASRSRVKDMLVDEKKSKRDTKQISWNHLGGMLRRNHVGMPNLEAVLEHTENQLSQMIDELHKKFVEKKE